MLSQSAAIAANRFGLGARAQDGAAIGNDARGWLGAQSTPPPKPTGLPAAAPQTSASVLLKFRDLRVARQAAAQLRASFAQGDRAQASDKGDGGAPPASPGIDEQAIKEFREFV